jgi:hypothetical protein
MSHPEDRRARSHECRLAYRYLITAASRLMVSIVTVTIGTRPPVCRVCVALCHTGMRAAAAAHLRTQAQARTVLFDYIKGSMTRTVVTPRSDISHQRPTNSSTSWKLPYEPVIVVAEGVDM